MYFSVVIPTYNRASVLTKTLSALTMQQEAPAYEVLVVDDGSTDSTAERVTLLQHDYPVPLHYYYQPNRKQGAARNLGARRALGKRLVFLGDDTVPRQDFLYQHRARTLEVAPTDAEKVVVIGYTTWPPEASPSRFLRYIGEQGWQFGFGLIEDSENVDFNFLYTSNVSLSKDFFLRSGGFDEDFQEYGWEDVELGWRLRKKGMNLVYAPEARTHHHHETDFNSFVERQRKVGFSGWNFYRKHPELGEFLGVDSSPRYSRFEDFKLRLLSLVAGLTENWRWPDLSRYYPDLMTYHYLRGLRAGREAFEGDEE